jgi:hypothetical protein
MSVSKPLTPARVASGGGVALSISLLSLCLLAVAPPVPAQTQTVRSPAAPPAPAASPAPSPAAATDEHDLSITANVTARELRFEVVPSPKVEFPGRPRRDTVWEAERTNLPPQVQPGVTYRDIGIRLKITSVFADIERIVAEALGEIPASGDAPPEPDANENDQPGRPPNSQPNPDADARPPAGHVTTTSAAAQSVDAPASSLPARTAPATSFTQTAPATSFTQTAPATSFTQTAPATSLKQTAPVAAASTPPRARRAGGIRSGGARALSGRQ